MAGIIFDLDGLLIDSEPLWQAAEINVFTDSGIHLTPADCVRTQGFRVAEVVRYWAEQGSWTADEEASLVNAIKGKVKQLVVERGVLMPGAMNAIERAHRFAPLALASSSPIDIIQSVLAHFGLSDAFAYVVSADNLEFGKPHPAVFIDAAVALGCGPESCIVFEDSLNGVVAAKAARMTCVAVPSSIQVRDARYCIADVMIQSLLDVTDELFVRHGRRWALG
jgi:HAD superfamily hydrolase (TIGR01509 family)